MEIAGTATSDIPIHLLHLLHLLNLPPKALSYAQLTVFGVNFPQMTDTSISSPLSFSDQQSSFSGGSYHSYRAGLVSWSFSLICIFMIFALAFHAFRSFLVGQNACLCCCCGHTVCYVMMEKHLPAAWIKRKDRNRMFSAGGEQQQQKSTCNNWITLKRKFPREINGEIDLLWCLQLLNKEQNITFGYSKYKKHYYPNDSL